jgi:hypothetical protein
MARKRSKQREGGSRPAASQELRDALLDLHKTLIDSERAVYETNVGPIQSPHHFFQLVSSDPWFAWLRPVSQLIVAMDEALDAEESLTSQSVDALMSESVFLLIPAERGGEFGERYMPWARGARPRESGQVNRFKKTASVRAGISVNNLRRHRQRPEFGSGRTRAWFVGACLDTSQ